ncbi:lytic murein transglycosylase [Patescibacteria group bacterium]|nr:lytic murein transglycosylase [Patescibacteria group bacterium]
MRSYIRKIRNYLILIGITFLLGWMFIVILIPPDPHKRLKHPEKYDPFEAAGEIKDIDPIIYKAIFAVETSSGTDIGECYVINRLDQRGKDFLLLICGENGLDPYKERGGDWGEIGLYHFLPETWLIDAEDGNGDGRRNHHDLADCLLAVGNYLNRHGYQYDVWEAVRRFNGNDKKSWDYMRKVKAKAIELGYKARSWNLAKNSAQVSMKLERFLL